MYIVCWLDKKIKKATINPITKKDNKCFQYAVTVAWNHEEIKKDPQRITIALNVLYAKNEKIYPA